jgi:hypothetical protein
MSKGDYPKLCVAAALSNYPRKALENFYRPFSKK